MLTALSFALSFVGGLHPSYKLDFEVTMVSIEPQSDRASYEQTIERSEYDARSKAKRLVFLKGAEKSILLFGKDEMTVENIHPDGSRQSKTFPTSKLPKSPEKLISFLSGQEGDLKFKQLAHEATKETKTIAGIKCRKETNRIQINDEVSEIVQWVPVDQGLRSRLPALEAYYYSVDSDNRKLTTAQIVTSVKLGPKPPKP